nr:MAG TPA: hypothetical protein [Caudoviricetes sp.]
MCLVERLYRKVISSITLLFQIIFDSSELLTGCVSNQELVDVFR